MIFFWLSSWWLLIDLSSSDDVHRVGSFWIIFVRPSWVKFDDTCYVIGTFLSGASSKTLDVLRRTSNAEVFACSQDLTNSMYVNRLDRALVWTKWWIWKTQTPHTSHHHEIYYFPERMQLGDDAWWWRYYVNVETHNTCSSCTMLQAAINSDDWSAASPLARHISSRSKQTPTD